MTSATTSMKGKPTTRLAAASLLALAMMLGACAAPADADTEVDVARFIADAQSQAEAIEGDLQRLEQQATDLPSALGGDVASAVASATAATEEARAALQQAKDSKDGAVVALEDAQVALEAASAEVKHVTQEASDAGADEVSRLLGELQEQIDALRGETENAAA